MAMINEISSNLFPKFRGCRSRAILTCVFFKLGNMHLKICQVKTV